MGERKVVNKFIPWDFDPDKVAKVKLSNIGQFSVRMMLPFTVRCNSCGEFMYAGKKFNTRKENANGEDYLGIPIQRFYFKCVNCGGEFAIKTDPKNSSYVVESGATRNSNIQLNERQQELEDQRKKEEAESMDAIKALENQTEEMKREKIKKQKELEAEEVERETKDQEELQDYLKAKKDQEIQDSENAFINAFAKIPKASVKRCSEETKGSAGTDAPPSKGHKVVLKKKKVVIIPK